MEEPATGDYPNETHRLHCRLLRRRRFRIVFHYAGAAALVRRSEQARLDSAELAISPGLDSLVYGHGRCGLAGLAEGRLVIRSDAALSGPIVIECDVVRAVLSDAVTGPGLW